MANEPGDTPDRNDLAEQLKKLSPEERKELLEEVEGEDTIPILRWSSNPKAVKAAFNYVEREGTVTFEDLRSHLNTEGHIDAEKGSYNFGVVDTEDGPFFNTNGDRNAGTEITLTDKGQEYAAVFDEQSGLRSIERTLLLGMQPYGSGFRFLSILEEHRDEGGILREDLQKKMEEAYGGSGKYFTGYYSSWFNKLGLLKKERVGRKVKYSLAVPSEW